MDSRRPMGSRPRSALKGRRAQGVAAAVAERHRQPKSARKGPARSMARRRRRYRRPKSVLRGSPRSRGRRCRLGAPLASKSALKGSGGRRRRRGAPPAAQERAQGVAALQGSPPQPSASPQPIESPPPLTLWSILRSTWGRFGPGLGPIKSWSGGHLGPRWGRFADDLGQSGVDVGSMSGSMRGRLAGNSESSCSQFGAIWVSIKSLTPQAPLTPLGRSSVEAKPLPT